ncbi:MAG: hypothetical protein QM817_25485 [Archangium sp.]
MKTLAVALALAASLALADDKVPTFIISNGTASGNAFVVSDFRPNSNAVLLMTALHVVSSAQTLTVLRPKCHETSGGIREALIPIAGGREALVWPELDLAAFELTRVEQTTILAGAAPAVIDLDAALPGGKVLLEGTSSISECQGGTGEVMSTPTVHVKFEGLRLAKTAANRGSLHPAAFLIQYEAPAAAPGLSGAPVVVDGKPGRVVGVHIAGYELKAVGWAMALSGQPLLRSLTPQIEHVGDWSRRVTDVHNQVAEFESAGDRAARRFAFGVELTAPLGFTRQFQPGVPAVGGLLAVQGELAAVDDASTVLLGGGAGVWYQLAKQNFLSPRDVVVASNELSQWGGVFEGFLGYRFLRHAFVRPELRAGLRFRFATSPMAPTDTSLGFMALAGANLKWSLFGIELLLDFAYDPAPRVDARYTGDGASVIRLEPPWVARLGLRAGVLWSP